MNPKPVITGFFRKPGWSFLILCLLLVAETNALRGQAVDTLFLSNISESRFQITEDDTAAIRELILRAEALELEAPDTSIAMLRAAIGQSRQMNYRRGIISGLLSLGTVYIHTGAYDQAITSFLLCLSLHPDDGIKARVYNGLGTSYYSKSNYKQGVNSFLQALDILERRQDNPHLLGRVYNNLSGTFFDMGMYEKGIFYLQKAEAIHRSLNNKRSLAMVLNNKGAVHIESKRYDEAIPPLQEALALSRSVGDQETEILVLSNLGEVYVKKGMLRKAFQYQQKAIANMAENTNPYTKGPILHTMGSICFLLGDYAQAEHFLNKTLELNIPKFNMDTHRMLSQLYGETGRYKQAWEHEGAYSRLRDSLMNSEKARGINQLETRYRTAQKDKELTEKQLLIAQQQIRLGRKNTWIWITSLSILLLGITSVLLYRNNRHRQYLQEEKIRVLTQEQEIKLLKAMMTGEEKERTRLGRELHDGVGGLLSAIKINVSTMRIHHKELAETEHFRNVLELVDEATSELRKTAHNLMPEVLLKGGLTEAIRNFCRHIPMEQIPEVEVQTYGEIQRLDLSFELAIYRIVQELVHNIIKHAQASRALVQLNWQDKLFRITIEDNGIGTTVESIRKSGGIGLKNIQARVNALEGQMELESTGSGTTVYIEFDVDQLRKNMTT
jgi:signal transduction histidine kinase/Tfp pilus assembly protein PilF